jgi:transcriptional regulator with XRE-family HTH domain
VEKSTHTSQYDALRAKLIEMRKAAKLNQRQLAAKLGREHSFVGRMEIGDRRLDVVELFWVCRALNRDPVQVFTEIAEELSRNEGQPHQKHKNR